MAAPRVTQQFIENIRSSALAPPNARVSQQSVEIIRSINIAAVANDTLAEAVAAGDAFFAGGTLPPATLAETVAVTSDAFTAKPPTGAIVPGAIDECALTVIVPGFDDDVTRYRVTMPGGPRVTLAGDVRISMAGQVRFTIPDETGAFRVTAAGNRRITLQ